MRTYDKEAVQRGLDLYDNQYENLDLGDWISNPDNVALINSKKDIALFERQDALSPSTVCGHYFFFSRGKEAIKSSKRFLKEIFSTPEYNVETIIGATPVEHKGAIWMNKRLGFKEHGTIDTVVGPCMFVLMTKQQWKDRQE